MARKSLQDLSGIAKTIANSSPQTKNVATKQTAPALGALQGALTAIRELDPALIDDWGPADRIDAFTAVNSDDDSDGFDALKESIKDDGQQVPILVRKAPDAGRFEVIYGRRRLRVCAELGLKVRANVQDLDDATALLAKGLENAARRNLSFYEKARFAVEIVNAGHDTKTVRKVLNLSASGLSHLTKITDNVPPEIGAQIGAAPKSGRPKWTALADAFIGRKVTAPAAHSILALMDASLSSDERLDRLLKGIARRGARPTEGMVVRPMKGITIKSGRTTTTVSIQRAGENADFATWLDHRLSDIIEKSYAEFTAVNTADDTTGKNNKGSS